MIDLWSAASLTRRGYSPNVDEFYGTAGASPRPTTINFRCFVGTHIVRPRN